MLDRQGSEVSVGGKVSASAQRLKQVAENGQVARTGMHDCRRRLIQPRSHQIESRIHMQRPSEQARPSREPKESEKDIPREAYRLLSG